MTARTMTAISVANARPNKKRRLLTLGAVYTATGQGDEPTEAVLGQPNTLAGARELAMAAGRKVARGVDPAGELKEQKAAAAQVDFAERDKVELVAASFVAKHVAALRPRTREQYEHVVNNMIVPEWRGRTIQTIGKRDVNDLLDKVRIERGPTAANRARAVLSKF